MKHLLTLLLSTTFFYCKTQSLYDTAVYSLFRKEMAPFYFGVASGDPTQHEVVIWSKVYRDEISPAEVKWEIATDTLMTKVVSSGVKNTDASSAYSVKVLVPHLSPGTTYFYRFECNGKFSPVGRTKTAPDNDVSKLRLGVVSCNNYEHGLFNAYGLLAKQTDIDAVLHLGDYIYEYGEPTKYKKLNVRRHIPTHEILTVQDYRSRYAEYRLDSNLQEAHRLFPFITIWDDHEFANDATHDGAKNHQPEEGDWEARKTIAKQVYFEWLPVKDNSDHSVIRHLNYGAMADIFMTDTRVESRSKQVSGPTDTALNNPSRVILGSAQANWLLYGVEHSAARWKIIGNQVVFSSIDGHKLSKKLAINPDAWDGYPVERNRIMDSLYAHHTNNIIIITGDIHTSWAFDLTKNPKDPSYYNRKTGEGIIGAEFVTPSISSGNLSARVPKGLGKMLGGLLKRKKTNPHLRFQNLVDHGFLILELTKDYAKSTWYFMRSIRKPTLKFTARNSWETAYDKNKLVKKLP